MRRAGAFRRFVLKGASALLVAGGFAGAAVHSAERDGRSLLLDARKGNCVACHYVPGIPSVPVKGALGPDLSEIRKRYPDRGQLRAAIWDLSERLPNTIMPPYGKHRILAEAEIDAVVRYLESL